MALTRFLELRSRGAIREQRAQLSSKASLRPGSGQEVIKRHAKGI
jgi:hypothetical protein